MPQSCSADRKGDCNMKVYIHPDANIYCFNGREDILSTSGFSEGIFEDYDAIDFGTLK